MSDTLLIHYDINKAQQASWSFCNSAGELTGKITSGPLQELSQYANRQDAVILLDSQCLHFNHVQLPTQNIQKQLKAIPYAIEEFIAEDVEEFHFVATKNKQQQNTSVVGIKKDTLQNIIDMFHAVGIQPQMIIPDALCLAADDSQWACLNYQHRSYLQTDSDDGLQFAHTLLPYMLHQRLSDEGRTAPEKLLLFCEQQQNTAFAELIDDEQIRDSGMDLIEIVYNQHPLVIFCGNYKQAAPLNLLQHAFKPKRKTSGYWHHWRLAASLAVVWLVLHLGLSGTVLNRLKQENRLTRAEIEDIYKKAFPESRKIVNPRVQMEQKLKQLKSGSGSSNNGFIFLLSEAFGTLSHDRKNITIQSLNFRNNRMDIGVDSTNLQAIENLNKNLNNTPSIKAEITSSSSEKDKVKGHIKIESRS